jgi:hypothetical protein
MLALRQRLPSVNLERYPPLPPDSVDASDERPINLLVMDGGGIKGLNLMVMVEEMERDLGAPAGEIFELMGGTSIGGCAAMFLSKFPQRSERGYLPWSTIPPTRGVQMARLALEELRARCLAHCDNWRLVWHGHLCPDERRAFILDLCGPDQRLGSEGTRSFALSSRKTRGGALEPFLFRSYDLGACAQSKAKALAGTSRALLWQAVEATSAAPTMFPRCVSWGRERFLDGMLIANDPTLFALREARTIWPNRPIGTVLSLGTGDASPTADDSAEARRLLKIRQAVQAISPSAKYYRFQPVLEQHDCSPFEHDEKRLRQMEDATRRAFRAGNRDLLAALRSSRGQQQRAGRARPRMRRPDAA